MSSLDTSEPRWPSASEAILEMGVISAEQVAIILKEVAGDAERSGCDRSPYPEGLLESLLARDDMEIDLAVARYTHDKKMAAALWEKPHLRQALADNRVAGPPDFLISKESVDVELAREFVNVIDPLLHMAFFTNPKLNLDILRELFERKGVYAELHDHNWLTFCNSAFDNPQLHKAPCELVPAGEGASGLRDDVFTSICRMLLTVEVSPRNAVLLSGLQPLAKLGLPCGLLPKPESCAQESREQHDEVKLKELSMLLTRWRASPQEMAERENELFTYEWIREGIASLIPSQDTQLLSWALTQTDVSIRRGVYMAKFYSTADDVREDFNRDGLDFLSAAIWNDSLYRVESRSAAGEFDSILCRNADSGKEHDSEQSQRLLLEREDRTAELFATSHVLYLNPG